MKARFQLVQEQAEAFIKSLTERKSAFTNLQRAELFLNDEFDPSDPSIHLNRQDKIMFQLGFRLGVRGLSQENLRQLLHELRKDEGSWRRLRLNLSGPHDDAYFDCHYTEGEILTSAMQSFHEDFSRLNADLQRLSTESKSE